MTTINPLASPIEPEKPKNDKAKKNEAAQEPEESQISTSEIVDQEFGDENLSPVNPKRKWLKRLTSLGITPKILGAASQHSTLLLSISRRKQVRNFSN